MNQFLVFLANLPRKIKAVFLIVLDTSVLGFSILTAFAIRFAPSAPDFDPATLEYQTRNLASSVLTFILLQLVGFTLCGLYRSVLRHAGPELISLLLRAILIGSISFSLLNFLIAEYRMPLSITIMGSSFAFVSLLSIRLIIRWVLRLHIIEPLHFEKFHRVAIYGAGSAGLQLYDSIIQEGTYQIAAFVDDNSRLQGGIVRGKPILSFDDIKKLHANNSLDSILLALPRIKHKQRKEILEKIRSLKVGVRILPTLDQLLRGIADASQLQEVDISDLLGRDEIVPDNELLHQDIKGRNVLVTGAGGTIGSELCLEILRDSPKILVLLELNEYSLYQAELAFRSLSSIKIVPCLGSVYESSLVENILRKHKIQTVYHAAAYKHVPLVEENPIEGLRNNILGTKFLLEKCIEANVSSFVLISTDKAVRPTNVMGASKRVAEMIVQDAASQFPESKLGIVRFGNVLDSSGSVVPLFREQIKKRQAITVTDPRITRYFMSIGEAARLVIQAGAMANKGEIFLLDMGEPVKINDLALQMIELSGLIPEKDINIKYTGLRPGEKLYEELLIEPALSKPTKHPRIFYSLEKQPKIKNFNKEIRILSEAISRNDLQTAFDSLKKLVPEYKPLK